MVWQETTADDEDTVSDAHTGGVTPTNVDEKMMHNIQVLLPDTNVLVGRVVAKAPQLIRNVTTNLCESWMHIRAKSDGSIAINRSQSGSWEHRYVMFSPLGHNNQHELRTTIKNSATEEFTQNTRLKPQ